MSKKKKNKKKFRAQLHQAMQEMQKDNSSPVENLNNTDARVTSNEEQKPESEPAKLSEVARLDSTRQAPPKVDEDVKSDEYSYVKKDVTKIIIVVAICVVILVGIWILSLQTNYVSNFANSLANFSHLSQGK